MDLKIIILKAFGNERMTMKNKLIQRILCTVSVLTLNMIVAWPQELKPQSTQTSASLEETRLKMEKWIETQQIISKERKEWQQGKEILTGRIDPVKNEIESIKEKIQQAESSISESQSKINELKKENEYLKRAQNLLKDHVVGIERKIQVLFPQLPDPIKLRIQPLYQRIPQDVTKTEVSIAERYQNVLGILNELNKANNEITVNYEVHTFSDGKPSEVKVFYVGLAQAYYVSSQGEAGIGKVDQGSWTWEPSPSIASDVMKSLDIIQGKHTPLFIPLPVKIQ